MAKKKRPKGKCRLCEQNALLCQSHIIPKFYFRWLRQTGSKYGRNPKRPNERIQDGLKPYLLCEACEEVFQRQETPFKENLFSPVVSNFSYSLELPPLDLGYGEELYLFALSVLWRILVSNSTVEGVQNNQVVVDAMERACREYLTKTSQEAPEIHMAILGANPELNPTKFFNSYMARSPDGCKAMNGRGEYSFVFAKLGAFLFFLPFDSFKQDWLQGTRIEPDGGRFLSADVVIGGGIFDFLVSRVREGRTMLESGVSANQKQVMRTGMLESIRLDPHSPHARVVLSDLSSKPKLGWGQTEPGRNEPCFCGSGAKYKKCCLE